jgi:hypothetical protein
VLSEWGAGFDNGSVPYHLGYPLSSSRSILYTALCRQILVLAFRRPDASCRISKFLAIRMSVQFESNRRHHFQTIDNKGCYLREALPKNSGSTG